ncbi:MAG: hypothetical protein Q4B26_11040 [Eubacteriales bacterium]|nr:hypothetical protein [Eubacteriales bacterium]
MSADEAIDMYIEKFGGFPFFMFMGADDSMIIEAVKKAIETGKPIAVKVDNEDY